MSGRVRRVHFVTRTPIRSLVVTFGTYAVRNVTRCVAAAARVTKCTAKPRPPLNASR